MPRDAIWSGVPAVKGSTEFTRMMLLTFCLIGLQLCWGLEMTYCMPYLLELGLTKTKTSLVWIAGPISGLVVAPIIGAVADNSRSKYGRRRPYMLGGSVVVCFCFWMLAWTTEIVEFFSGAGKGSPSVVILLAVFSIYAVDFAINVVQWSCRGLIVDTLPTTKQQLGSAWAGRMTAFGHLVGYAVGALDLKQIFGSSFGGTQFKQMTVISAFSLLLSVAVSSWATTEKVLVARSEHGHDGSSPVRVLREIHDTVKHMPPRITAICWVQFWSWLGWFPFLFYSSTWVGEIYFTHDRVNHVSTDKSGDIGRIGSTALIVFSTVTFAASILLPWLVQSPEDERTKYTARPPKALAGIVQGLPREKLKLTDAWLIGQIVFAVSMGMAPMVGSVRFATLLIGLCGISWAISSWAPFTFIGVEINRMGKDIGMHSDERRGRKLLGTAKEEESIETGDGESGSGGGALAGLYLGILNLFTAGPQFIGSFISMAVFAAVESGPQDGEGKAAPDSAAPHGGVNAIAICLFIGALSSAMAAYSTRRLRG